MKLFQLRVREIFLVFGNLVAISSAGLIGLAAAPRTGRDWALVLLVGIVQWAFWAFLAVLVGGTVERRIVARRFRDAMRRVYPAERFRWMVS